MDMVNLVSSGFLFYLCSCWREVSRTKGNIKTFAISSIVVLYSLQVQDGW